MLPIPPSLKNFRSFTLALEFYEECKKVKLKPSLKDQLNRATEGIVLTLAEGSAKASVKDRARYYGMAFASFRESQVILMLAQEARLLTRFDRLGGCLYKLSRIALPPQPDP